MIRMVHASKADAARKTHFIREFKTRSIVTFTASFLSLYHPRMSVTGTCPERQHATGNCEITIGNRPNPLQGEHRMKPLKWLPVVALSGALAACASDIQRVRSAEGTGSPFTRALTTEYKDFSTFEADEMNDWSNARHFARKGMLASQGEVVQPEDLGNWKLPHGRVDELTAARAKLVGLLDAGARDRVPEPAARAQARFDCWV